MERAPEVPLLGPKGSRHHSDVGQATADIGDAPGRASGLHVHPDPSMLRFETPGDLPHQGSNGAGAADGEAALKQGLVRVDG